MKMDGMKGNGASKQHYCEEEEANGNEGRRASGFFLLYLGYRK